MIPELPKWRYWTLVGLTALIFFVPVSVYGIGSMLGAGVQFPLFRYQDTYMGTNVITIVRDLEYVLEGTISGRSALMPIVWISGFFSAVIGLLSVAVPARMHGWYSPRRGGVCIMGAGFLYLVALVVQYGPTFLSSGGFAIPVGVPVIVAAGWLVWSGALFSYANETDECVPEISQDNSS
ncbi:MAG: hypothetical protein WC346_03790 [Methanogenium sp.]|jgi:hypothetical protein